MNNYRASDIKPTGKPGTVYLLHFKRPYRHCRHYIGFTARKLDIRLGEHWRGNGSALTAAVKGQTGNAMILARTWTNVDSSVEFIIKCRAESPTLCPICNPDAMKLAQYDKETAQ